MSQPHITDEPDVTLHFFTRTPHLPDRRAP